MHLFIYLPHSFYFIPRLVATNLTLSEFKTLKRNSTANALYADQAQGSMIELKAERKIDETKVPNVTVGTMNPFFGVDEAQV